MDYDDYRVADTERFLARVEEDLRRARPGEPLPQLDAIDGSDASGTVHCVVALDGQVRQVGIMSGWWDRLGPPGAGRAVIQAWEYARQKAGLAESAMMERGFPVPVPEVAPARREPEPHGRAARWAALQRSLERSLEEIDALDRKIALITAKEPRTVSGPNGLFHVRLEGVRVVGAVVNEYGVGHDSGDALAQDARAALLAATAPIMQPRS